MVEIASGKLGLGLVPEVGGSIAYFRLKRNGASVDLMRPLSEGDRGRRDPLGVAMFPMVPYANRIAGNCFSFRGRSFEVKPNFPPDPLNVHGSGWLLPWTVARVAADEAVLELSRNSAAEPHQYVARQRFKLSPERLLVHIEVRNSGTTAMPFGFGQHPWFIRDPDVTVRFVAGAFWIEGTDGIPTEKIRTPPELGFTDPTHLPKARRNNCYGLWDGLIEIAWPSRRIGLRIEADPVFMHLMLYCDPARTAFCLEPQTNVVGAFNMVEEDLHGYDAGVIVLEPGAAAGGSISFVPFDL